MRISVALATYEGARFLDAQLESIARQTRPADELVIGDDRSSDRTVEILESFARHSHVPITLCVNETRLGSAGNFEAVIRRCSGDVIALADQDDVWHPAKLDVMQRALAAQHQPGLAFSDCELIDELSRPLGTTGWDSVGLTARERRAIGHGHAFRTLVERQHRNGGTVTGATMAFRSRFRDLVLPFPELLPESGKGLLHDAWIALLVSAVAAVETIPAPLVQHRQHAAQQVGMPVGRGPKRRFWAAPTTAASFESARRWLATLQDRLETSGGDLPTANAIATLHAFDRHLDARGALPGSRPRRVPPVFRELVAGRYHAFSSGFGSAARDLIA